MVQVVHDAVNLTAREDEYNFQPATEHQAAVSLVSSKRLRFRAPWLVDVTRVTCHQGLRSLGSHRSEATRVLSLEKSPGELLQRQRAMASGGSVGLRVNMVWMS